MEKFKNVDEDFLLVLVCIDLVVCGLDFVCDYVINFDFFFNFVSEFFDGYVVIFFLVFVLFLLFFLLLMVFFLLYIKGFCDFCCEEKYEVFVLSRCFCVGVLI